MEVDQKISPQGGGLSSYYRIKCDELSLVIAEKSIKVRRLQAERDDLNAKGN